MTVLVQNVIRHTHTHVSWARGRRCASAAPVENANVPGETGPGPQRAGAGLIVSSLRTLSDPHPLAPPPRHAKRKNRRTRTADRASGVRMLGRGKVSRFREPRAARNPRCRGDAWMRSETEKGDASRAADATP